VLLLEGLLDEFFAFLPESLSIIRVECIRTHSFADDGDGDVIRHHCADVAVLAVLPANLVGGSDHTSPYRCCSALRNRFPLERTFTFRGKLRVDLFNQLFDATGFSVATQFCLYAPRMHGCSANATSTVSLVEGDCEQNVRRLRAAVCDEGIVGRALKIWVLQVDVGITVTCGR
jgi:hypothetical protein